MGVLTWGHLSHWLLTASCSDIWPQNSAWQRPSNSLRSVRQTHTHSWKQPTHRRTHALLNSQDHTFLTDVLCLHTPADAHANITVRALILLLMCHRLRLLHHRSSFRDRITVPNSILLNYWVFYKRDKAFCQHTRKPGFSLLSLLEKVESFSPPNIHLPVNLNNTDR